LTFYKTIMINLQTIKKDFPIFTHQKELVYLDSAATALKPQTVIDAEKKYLEQYSSNVGRGLYPLAETATEKFEAVREKIARFIGAADTQEIIFTSGTTASINLAAGLLAESVHPADNIVVTEMEHHSNYLPWKELAKKCGASFHVIPITGEGAIDIATLKNSIDERTKIAAFSAVSNVLGTINPVEKFVAAIKGINPQTLVLVDAAQAAPHMRIDVSLWRADFVAFSGHKMFGPTGVGVLYGKAALLETFPPIVFGGGMVLDACAEDTRYREIPYRFEAGTPNIGGVIALGAALDYIENIGFTNIRAYETALTAYAQKRLQETFDDAIRIIGPKDTKDRGGIIAFSLKNIHPHDIAQLLGEQNICVRAGEHCAAPLHRRFGLSATTRLSLSIYNSEEDIEKLITALKEIQKIFSVA